MQYRCADTPRICLAYKYHKIHCLHTFFLLTPRYPLPSHIQMIRSNSPSRAHIGARGVNAGRCCTPARARTGTGSSAVRNTTHAKRTCATNCRADAGARQAEYCVQRTRDPGASPRLAEEVCSSIENIFNRISMFGSSQFIAYLICLHIDDIHSVSLSCTLWILQSGWTCGVRGRGLLRVA